MNCAPTIDPALIRHEFAPFQVQVELGRLKFFAAATGNASPLYSDERFAGNAGYRSIPLPPTYLFTLEMERDDPNDFLDLLGIDMSRILYGEQSFTYHKVACGGDRLTFRNRIADIYVKKGGALQFVVVATDVLDTEDLDCQFAVIVRAVCKWWRVRPFQAMAVHRPASNRESTK